MRHKSPERARFDAAWQRRRRFRATGRKLGWSIGIVGIVGGLWWFGLIPNMATRNAQQVDRDFAVCGQGAGAAACVADGDTVSIGLGTTRRRIRLTGYDAPEMDGACNAEQVKARSARRELVNWLNAGPFQWDGGDAPPYDRYGRELRTAWRQTSHGKIEWLADHMIESGLASESGWGATPIDWCDQTP